MVLKKDDLCIETGVIFFIGSSTNCVGEAFNEIKTKIGRDKISADFGFYIIKTSTFLKSFLKKSFEYFLFT